MTGKATATQDDVYNIAQDTARTTQRVGAEIQGIAATGIDAVKMVPDLATIAALPKAAVGAAPEIHAAWIEWMDLIIGQVFHPPARQIASVAAAP